MGLTPTGIVATTVFEASDITLTVFPPKLATKISPFALSYAKPCGLEPATIWATTPLEASDITLKLFDSWSETKISPFALS